jgi:hypothetical protein
MDWHALKRQRGDRSSRSFGAQEELLLRSLVGKGKLCEAQGGVEGSCCYLPMLATLRTGVQNQFRGLPVVFLKT